MLCLGTFIVITSAYQNRKLMQIYVVGANFKISTHATRSSAQSHCLITYPLPGVGFL